MTPTADLPTADQLEKLTLRAIVAFAVKAARRICVVFKESDELAVIEASLSSAQQVATSEQTEEVSAAHLADAAGRVIALVAKAESSDRRRLAALAISRAIRAAYAAVQADSDKPRSREYLKYGARAASQAARVTDILDEPAASAAIDAAIDDYQNLLSRFGDHESVVLGPPVEKFS